MVVLVMAYCTCTVLFFCLYFVYCIIYIICVQFIFYLGGQSVRCKASLAALLLYGYFCDFVSCYYRRINMMMTMIHFCVCGMVQPCAWRKMSFMLMTLVSWGLTASLAVLANKDVHNYRHHSPIPLVDVGSAFYSAFSRVSDPQLLKASVEQTVKCAVVKIEKNAFKGFKMNSYLV